MSTAKSRVEAQILNLGSSAAVLIQSGWGNYLDAIRRAARDAQKDFEARGYVGTDEHDALLAASVATMLVQIPRAQQEKIVALALDVLEVDAEKCATAAAQDKAGAEATGGNFTFQSPGGDA